MQYYIITADPRSMLVVHTKRFKLEPYKQKCKLNDCAHVVIKVGQPAVHFTLCKARIMHESNFFRVAFQDDKFKEGDQYVVELREEDAVQFKLFITTMFPHNKDSYTPLTSEHLTLLLRCADQYDAFGCAAVTYRITASVKEICQNGALHQPVKDILVATSKYNLDKDLIETLVKRAALIPDIYKLKDEVKHEILFPILCRQMACLSNEIRSDSMRSYFSKMVNY